MQVGAVGEELLFARVLGLEYLPGGAAGGGTRSASNAALPSSRARWASEAARSPWWGAPSLALLFSLRDLAQLARLVCEDAPPCAGDLTPFVLLPPPLFVPASFYPNYLALVPRQGLLWPANQLSSPAVFARQPAHAVATYDGHVTQLQTRLSLALLRELREQARQQQQQQQQQGEEACPGWEEAWQQPREFERAGWYPNTVRVSYDPAARRFTVAMAQLQYRQDYASKLQAITKVFEKEKEREKNTRRKDENVMRPALPR